MKNLKSRFNTELHNSFRQQGFKEANQLVNKEGVDFAKNYFFKEIISKPLVNLKMSFLFAYRGLYYSVVFFICFIFIFFQKISNLEKHQVLLLFSFSIFTILFHAAITHFNVRYGYPLVIGLSPSCAIVIKYFRILN